MDYVKKNKENIINLKFLKNKHFNMEFQSFN
jgi:hypothetical protein